MNINFKQHALKLALVSAFALGASALGVNAYAATATGTATATVIAPIGITADVDLAFGKFAAGTGGTVVMDPAGARTATGGVVLSTVVPGAAASFSVTGDNNATYAITLPGIATTITSGVNNMSVGTFTSTPSATGTLSGLGAQTVTVGGTLTVATGQVAGAYTGSFDVTVEYN
jgi:hypothetical protein